MVSIRKYQKLAEANNFNICKSKLTKSLTEERVAVTFLEFTKKL